MHIKSLVPSLALVAGVSSAAAAEGLKFSVHHRGFNPNEPNPWVLKGIAEIDTEDGSSRGNFVNLHSFAEAPDAYQVAVSNEGQDESTWNKITVDGSVLRHGKEAITLTLGTGKTPLINFDTTPSDTSLVKDGSVDLFWNNIADVESERLAEPVFQKEKVVSEEQPEETGKPPEKEKSFIQKYWMYILLAVFIISLQAPMPDEEKKNQ